MSENPFAEATRDPIALLEQLMRQVGGLGNRIDEVKEDLTLVKEDLAQVKQSQRTTEERLTSLESAFRSFRDDTAAHLDRFDILFDHIARKLVDNEAEISRLRRRQG